MTMKYSYLCQKKLFSQALRSPKEVFESVVRSTTLTG